jgi:uncharacterized cupin superfamily protein
MDCAGWAISALSGDSGSKPDKPRHAIEPKVTDLYIRPSGADMSDFITVLRETCPTPVVDATKWKRIGGDPHTVNLNAYLSKDGSKIMGTWICTPGKFEVNYEKWEYCHFLDGYCIITPEGEQPVHLKAGDVFVIEPGMKGTWEVVETVRKYFVFA